MLNNEPVVANPVHGPCRDDARFLAMMAWLNLDGTLTTVSAPNARTDQTPDDLAASAPTIGDRAAAHADTADVSIGFSIGNPIAARSTVVDARAECAEAKKPPALSATSKVVGLSVGGRSYDVLTEQREISVVGGTLRVDATIESPGRITRRALWLDRSVLPDVIVGEAIADFEGNPCDA